MQSRLHFLVCDGVTTKIKKDAGPWFYRVCQGCDTEVLLNQDNWK